MASNFELVYEGATDESIKTLQRLKAAFVADLELPVEEVQRILANAPTTIINTDSADLAERYQEILSRAGAKVLIVRPANVEDATPARSLTETPEKVADECLFPSLAPTPAPAPTSKIDLLFELDKPIGAQPPEVAPKDELAQSAEAAVPISLELYEESPAEKQPLPATPSRGAPAPPETFAILEIDSDHSPATAAAHAQPVAETAQSEEFDLTLSLAPAEPEPRPIVPIPIEQVDAVEAPAPETDSLDEAPEVLDIVLKPALESAETKHSPPPSHFRTFASSGRPMPSLKDSFTKQRAEPASSSTIKGEYGNAPFAEESAPPSEEPEAVAASFSTHDSSRSAREILLLFIAGLVLLAGGNMLYARFFPNDGSTFSLNIPIDMFTQEQPAAQANPTVGSKTVIGTIHFSLDRSETSRRLKAVATISAAQSGSARGSFSLQLHPPAPAELTPEEIVLKRPAHLWLHKIEVETPEFELDERGEFKIKTTARFYIEQGKNRNRGIATALVQGQLSEDQKQLRVTSTIYAGMETVPLDEAPIVLTIERSYQFAIIEEFTLPRTPGTTAEK